MPLTPTILAWDIENIIPFLNDWQWFIFVLFHQNEEEDLFYSDRQLMTGNRKRIKKKKVAKMTHCNAIEI